MEPMETLAHAEEFLKRPQKILEVGRRVVCRYIDSSLDCWS